MKRLWIVVLLFVAFSVVGIIMLTAYDKRQCEGKFEPFKTTLEKEVKKPSGFITGAEEVTVIQGNSVLRLSRNTLNSENEAGLRQIELLKAYPDIVRTPVLIFSEPAILMKTAQISFTREMYSRSGMYIHLGGYSLRDQTEDLLSRIRFDVKPDDYSKEELLWLIENLEVMSKEVFNALGEKNKRMEQ